MKDAGSKKIERETAKRIFAREFNDSNLQYGEKMDRAPNYIISPTGAVCNRIFIVGVLTEVENIGSEGQTLYRARIADPTGVFTIYAGQYQPHSASFLSKAITPSYIAVAGKARIFTPEEKSFYTSIRPEEINTVDEYIRDRWVYHTARLTADRIRVMEKALSSGYRGNELSRLIEEYTEDYTGVSKAVDHYQVTLNTIEAYRQMTVHALTSIAGPIRDKGAEETDEKSPEDILWDTIAALDEGSGVSYEKLLGEMEKLGFTEPMVDSAINSLMDSGKCYEPRIGILKLVRG
jgi:hypothetical protein